MEGLNKLFAKIATISGEIGAIQKDATHAQNYKYHSADAIMGALNHLMAQHGLVVVPTAPDWQIAEGRYVIRYCFVLCDAETGATFESLWLGEAPLGISRKDGSLALDDKAMGKAHTYAFKYWMMKLFMISTVDTDDLDTNHQEGVVKPSKAAQDKQEAAPKPSNPQAWENDLITLVTPLFKARDHAKNAVNGLLQNKVIVKGQAINEAAAAVFQNRALKEYEADEEILNLVLGKHPKDFKQTPEAFKAAWEMLAKVSKQANDSE